MQPQQATERVTTLMTKDEKSILERKAKQAGVSVGEFVRRSVDAYDSDQIENLAQLAELAADLQRSNREAGAALDKALASLSLTRAELDKRAIGEPA